MNRELVLIDLSSVLYPIWHTSGKDPDPDATSTKTIERVYALSSGRTSGVAICCDSGRTFRHDITPTYKATRPEHDATRQHQIQIVMDTLRADGFPVWAVKGFESDDIISTCVLWTSVQPELSVLICSSDKDLLSLVGPTVRQKRLHDDSIYDAAKVLEVCKVRPDQMVDYISLVGDTSDNIIGAKGIGAVKAATLLTRFGSMDNMYAALEIQGAASIGITPKDGENLRAFKESGAMALARSLVTLRTDVPLPCEEILAERVPVKTGEWRESECAPQMSMSLDGKVFLDGGYVSGPAVEPVDQRLAAKFAAGIMSTAGIADVRTEPVTATSPYRVTDTSTGRMERPMRAGDVETVKARMEPPSQAMTVREPAEVLPAPPEWERQLEPRSMREAIGVADLMFKSRLFSAYGTPPAVLSAIMSGREIGMPTMASLRVLSGHVIDGKQTFPADLLRALVLKSGKAKYFKCTERTNERATFVTHRVGDDEPVSLTFTIEDGRRAWATTEEKWLKSGYIKNPADMCVARSSSKLARLVYPDVCAGMYSREEME